MPTITLRHHATTATGFDAALFFDHSEEYPVAIHDPFSAQEEARLGWYFEEHLRFPFTDQVRAREAAASIVAYGQVLFGQLFADPEVLATYRALTQGNLAELTVEIAGPPEFHALHWEALKDPKLAQPLALQATFVRRNRTPQPVKATLREAPTVNVLLVTARPGGSRDVGYRTIAGPLVETLRQANLRVHIDLLRPGTYEALVRHLEATQERHGPGYYHVVHFDVHGGLLGYNQFEAMEQGLDTDRFTYQMRRYGRPTLPRYDGVKAFLMLEGPQAGQADPVEAAELAGLLQVHGVPIVVLNACQSGKQVGDRETSLGSQLMQAGVQMALAMSYSVTVSAAERLMREFYGQLFGGASLAAAVRSGRMELHNRKGRRAYFNQVIDLEDWLLPVVYENRPQALRPREFTPEESAAFYSAQAARYEEPQVAYRFVGRDLDVLEIERRLLGVGNILLLRGMAGAGKTTLLRHLGWWWQTTGFVDQVFYFGYDQRAWTRQQLMDAIAPQLLGEVSYVRDFQPLGLEAQQALLAERLRGTRHLLALDNLESITGAALAIQHTLPPAEQAALQRFLHALAGGRTLVLLGSRGGEAWLQGGTFGENVYTLPGLDEEAASELADLVLERHGAARYRSDPDLRRLLALLNGYPLALEVLLPNLARQTPAEVLAALWSGAPGLEGGEIDLASPDIEKKTQSILHCIAYSHANLSPEAQTLLLCLAPFTGVIYLGGLEAYTEVLRRQPLLAALPFERWVEVLGEAVNWGLLTEHEVEGFLAIQPTLPYFLRSRLHETDKAAVRAAVETAFREHYDEVGKALFPFLESKRPLERQLGQLLIHLEYENINTALQVALRDCVSILHLYPILSGYLDAVQDQARGLELGVGVMASLEQQPAGALHGQRAIEFVAMLDSVAKRQVLLKQHTTAQQLYQQALDLLQADAMLDSATKSDFVAGLYHQLGIVALEQRQWAQANEYFQQALAIFIEFNDREGQASTYHNLGLVALEQRQWAQAHKYYQQALAIFVEFDDRYEQARTYYHLGFSAQEQRQWAQANKYHRQALAIYVEFDDRHSQALTLQALGAIAQEQRHCEQANAYYQQALAIFIEFNDRHNQAHTYHNLGTVAQEQRQWAQANAYYQQALAIFIEFNDGHNQAHAYHNLGIVAQEQRLWAQAGEYFLKDLEISVESGDIEGTVITLRSLVEYYKAAHDATLPAAVAAILRVSPDDAQSLLARSI
jgi:tetratricopeptide (TPR) repeat protein